MGVYVAVTVLLTVRRSCAMDCDLNGRLRGSSALRPHVFLTSTATWTVGACHKYYIGHHTGEYQSISNNGRNIIF